MHEIDFRIEKGMTYKTIVWLTDLHLDFLYKPQYLALLDMISKQEPDLVLIGGDIANGISCLNHLKKIASITRKKIYYVLGNHDYYYGSIAETRRSANQLTESNPNIVYLTGDRIVELSENTALIGHDGWADGRAGNFMNSTVDLNDYVLIDELKGISKEERLLRLNGLGDEAALLMEKQLKSALKQYQRVIMLTHVPPFERASVYHGIPSNSNWAPHFVCKALGAALKRVMESNKDKELLVLCGHTHSSVDVNILPNLRVVAGQSEYGIPNLNGLIFA